MLVLVVHVTVIIQSPLISVHLPSADCPGHSVGGSGRDWNQCPVTKHCPSSALAMITHQLYKEEVEHVTHGGYQVLCRQPLAPWTFWGRSAGELHVLSICCPLAGNTWNAINSKGSQSGASLTFLMQGWTSGVRGIGLSCGRVHCHTYLGNH